MTHVVTAVKHHGACTAHGAASFTYQNKLRAFPSEQAVHYAPPARTPSPRIPGVMTAMIESGGAQYAAIDDMGRYRVRLPFDISDTASAEATKGIRLAAAYAGANYGMHFPSHEGTEMVIACVDGNPDRPIGLATVPNAATLPPVTSANNTQNIIRTAGNNEFLMDDADGEQVVRLTSASGNVLELSDADARASVVSTDGNAVVLDDAAETVTISADKHVIALSYARDSTGVVISTKSGHVVRLDDKQKRVTVQSAGGHAVDLDDQKKTITLRDCDGKNTVTLDASQGISLDSKAQISIHASKDLVIKAANIKMSTTSGSIEAKATQDMKLSGMKIEAKASAGDIVAEGLNVSLKGKLKAVLEGGAGAEVTAKAKAKVSGAITELSGSAMTTVKGGVVMIN